MAVKDGVFVFSIIVKLGYWILLPKYKALNLGKFVSCFLNYWPNLTCGFKLKFEAKFFQR